ncbi:sensor histidine kinase [Gallaecimonas xiamenensis]|uniref:histidine kinase n=1 Tax=Gallaecimonas xiamenensis 3-C-1 TaxID=745411 RepID=K2JMX1_9GAMM|nr:histidine kinase [Gallaecimonas xiamenensis]EKE76618.1 sensor histidine kinase [Gallaecimonas xiamenensis 3-C-1]
MRRSLADDSRDVGRTLFGEYHDRYFWLLHSFGWLSYGALFWISNYLAGGSSRYWVHIAFLSGTGWLLSIPLRYFYRRIWNNKAGTIVLLTTLACLLVGMVWQLARNFFYFAVLYPNKAPDAWSGYYGYVVAAVPILAAWSGLYFGIKYYRMLQLMNEKALKAANAAQQAQLRALRYQLNPHFLFNTLNAISTLVMVKENDTANRMVTGLADFLRYSLENDPIRRVPLEQEVRAMERYLAIEQVRFSDRLKVHWQVDEEAKAALVPSLILQPLIENAIKYGVAGQEQGGNIWISGKRFGSDLLLAIGDDGPGLGQGKSTSTGVGLANTRERLQTLYGEDFAFTLSSREPSGLTVNLRIPYQTEE